MSNIVERLNKSEFTCDMCNSFSLGRHSYVYKSFEILPKTPSEKLQICEKCAKREHGAKNKIPFEDIFV